MTIRIHSRTTRCILAAAAIACVNAAPIFASSEPQPNAEFPTRVEDASVTETGQFQSYLPTRYLHLDDGTDQLQWVPELNYGFGEVFEFDVKVPVFTGDADSSGSGDIELSLQWQALDEKQGAPVTLSIEPQIAIPTGEGSAGLDTQLSVLVTKQVGREETKDQLHFNAAWTRNAANAADERENQGFAILGYSRLLSKQTLLVADIVREWGETHSEESNLIEVGVIHAISDNLKLGTGVGTGIGDESPHITATVGAAYDF